MELASPYFLLLLLFAPFLIESWFFRSSERASSALFFVSPVALEGLPKSVDEKVRRYLLSSLRLICFVMLVVALARPRTLLSTSEAESSGRDIMLALDISGSMRAIDFKIDGKPVTRLAALKTVVKDFVSQRQGDRIGLVIFGTEVYTQCPLTTDHQALNGIIDSLNFGMVGDGTALGDGLAIAIKRLRTISADSKTIVLVTDGQQTAGTMEPQRAAELAGKYGIKVYTIGIGGKKPAPIEVPDLFGNPTLRYLPVQLDDKTLQEIAQISGGKYYNAEDTESLRGIYQEISKLEERLDRSPEIQNYDEKYLPFLLVGMLFFFFHELLAATRYLTVP